MVTASKTTAWPQDSTCVEVHRENELLYWCSRFGVSQLVLRQAVRLVGSKFRDVAVFLKTRHLPNQTSG
jgi:hypothetical protein